MTWRAGLYLALTLALLCAPLRAAAKRNNPYLADAAELYNAGTRALARRDLGPAVTFLLAAYRIDPRARDIRTNLGIARARVDESQGSQDQTSHPAPPPVALSWTESWYLAVAFALAGTLISWLAATRRHSTRLLITGTVFFAVGFLCFGALLLRAREEAVHPTAVVVAPVLDVGPLPEERPLPPYLLGAGDEVRLGPSRGDLVQVRVGGNAIGWAKRAGLWRVADAPRYTRDSGS